MTECCCLAGSHRRWLTNCLFPKYLNVGVPGVSFLDIVELKCPNSAIDNGCGLLIEADRFPNLVLKACHDGYLVLLLIFILLGIQILSFQSPFGFATDLQSELGRRESKVSFQHVQQNNNASLWFVSQVSLMALPAQFSFRPQHVYAPYQFLALFRCPNGTTIVLTIGVHIFSFRLDQMIWSIYTTLHRSWVELCSMILQLRLINGILVIKKNICVAKTYF